MEAQWATLLNGILFPYEMANRRIYNLRSNAIQEFAQTLSYGTIDWFSKTLVHFPRDFGKASEVDLELECEMHQIKYKVMIGCDMD
jgi:hypothetical protein